MDDVRDLMTQDILEACATGIRTGLEPYDLVEQLLLAASAIAHIYGDPDRIRGEQYRWSPAIALRKVSSVAVDMCDSFGVVRRIEEVEEFLKKRLDEGDGETSYES
jgi:hypothetical protein